MKPANQLEESKHASPLNTERLSVNSEELEERDLDQPVRYTHPTTLRRVSPEWTRFYMDPPIQFVGIRERLPEGVRGRNGE